MDEMHYYKLSKVEKENIAKIISKVLDEDEKVIFAYLFGSFLREDFFKDIDIFVFIVSDVDSFSFPVGLKEKLIDAFTEAGIYYFSPEDLDINILNRAPFDFAIDVLSKGLLLVDKNPEFRTDYIEYISNQYRLNQSILEELYK